MSIDPVPIASEPLLSVATTVWRYAGTLYVTAIAKRSFALDLRGARPTAPAPVVRVELDAGAGRIVPDEMAPCLAGGEVWVAGSVAAQPPAVDVALRVRRGERTLLEKRVRATVDASRAASLHALAPLSKRWPARANRLRGIAAAPLEGPLVAVPDALDWRYFHAAPADQTLQSLAPGDEISISLVGRGTLSLTIPAELPLATLTEPGQHAQRVALGPDVVGVDVASGVAHIVYRGRAVLSGDPRRAQIEVRTESRLDGDANAMRDSSPDARLDDSASTTHLAPADVAALRAKYALPFRGDAAPAHAVAANEPPAPPAPSMSGMTAVADESAIAALRAQYLPFGASRPPPAAPPPPSPMPPPPPIASPVRLTPPPPQRDQRAPGPPPAMLTPEAPSPNVSQTAFGDDVEELLALRAQFATPFEKPSAKLARAGGSSPLAKPSAPEPPTAQSGETTNLDPADVEALRAQYKSPFKAAPAAPAPAESKDAGKLGANFLDALEDGGKKKS